MHEKIYLSVLILGLVSCGNLPTPNSNFDAKSTYESIFSSENQEGEFAKLTPEQQSEILELAKPVDIRITNTVLPLRGDVEGLDMAQSGCFTSHARREYWGTYSQLFALNTYIDFCTNGSTITWIAGGPVIPEIYFFLWRYEGIQSDYARGGQGNTSASRMTTGHFTSGTWGVDLRNVYLTVNNVVSAINPHGW